MEYFKNIPVVLLKDYKGDRNKKYKAGTQVNVQLMPSGQLYLMSGIVALAIDPVEGVDFEYLHKIRNSHGKK